MGNGDMNGETIRRWLPTILVALGLAVTWGSTTTQLDVLAEEVAALKQEDTKHDARERNADREVAALAANQKAVKEDIEEIKQQIKEQDKKLDKILEEIRKD